MGQGQHQLPLEIRLRDDATLDNFLPRPQLQDLLAALAGQAGPQGESAIYLCGPPGSGKSHLLQASCHAPDVQSLYLPLGELRHFAPADVLHNIAGMDLVCLDDLHLVAGDDDWETALFNFYNEARESGCRLLLSAQVPPRMLPLALEDLRSRLAWAVVYQIEDADDEVKAEVLSFRAMRRGITLSPGVAAYIVARAPRSLHELLGLLDTLDDASLAHKRALSIPFVKESLGW